MKPTVPEDILGLRAGPGEPVSEYAGARVRGYESKIKRKRVRAVCTSCPGMSPGQVWRVWVGFLFLWAPWGLSFLSKYILALAGGTRTPPSTILSPHLDMGTPWLQAGLEMLHTG